MKQLIFSVFILFLATQIIGQETYQYSETFDVDKKGVLTLATEDADIEITGSDREDLYVDVYRKVSKKGFVRSNKEFDISYVLKDGNLTIAEKESSSSYSYVAVFGTMNIDYRIKVELPNSMSLKISGEDDNYVITSISGDIALTSEDGDVKLNKINNSNLKIDLEDGDVTLTECHSENVDYKGEDGDLTFDGEVEDMTIDIVDGNVKVVKSIIRKLNVVGEDGDIDMELLKSINANVKLDDGTVVIRSADSNEPSQLIAKLEDGDIALDFTSLAKLDLKSEDGDIDITSGVVENSEFKIHTNDGDVDYKIMEGYANFELETDDGSIKFPKSFNVKKDKKSYKEVSNGASNAMVVISTEDGNIKVR